jgi:hypothetical protein
MVPGLSDPDASSLVVWVRQSSGSRAHSALTNLQQGWASEPGPSDRIHTPNPGQVVTTPDSSRVLGSL